MIDLQLQGALEEVDDLNPFQSVFRPETTLDVLTDALWQTLDRNNESISAFLGSSISQFGDSPGLVAPAQTVSDSHS